MEFSSYILFISEQWYLYIPLLILVIFLYLCLFRKYIWSIFDPLFVTAITMGSAAFVVFSLWLNDFVDPKYVTSFLCTEIFFIIGFFWVSNYFSVNVKTFSSLSVNILFVKMFAFITGLLASVLQFYIFYQLGFGLFREGVNHVSIFDGFGALKAFQEASSTIYFISFFYKKRISVLRFFDYLFFLVLIIAILLSGSKAGLLRPVAIFFIVEYYFYRKTGKNIVHVKLIYLLCLSLFPLLVIITIDNVGFFQSILLFGIRLIGSGDIFVMGYDDDVVRHISANSFWQYIFYPGWGSILKTIGFSITPPPIIGVDIYNYHYGLTNAGPNTRLNFLAYYFFGTFWGSMFAGFIGFFVGYVRSKFGQNKHNFFVFFLSIILYLNIFSLVADINFFLNNFFWDCIILTLLYLLTQIVYKGLMLKK